MGICLLKAGDRVKDFCLLKQGCNKNHTRMTKQSNGLLKIMPECNTRVSNSWMQPFESKGYKQKQKKKLKACDMHLFLGGKKNKPVVESTFCHLLPRKQECLLRSKTDSVTSSLLCTKMKNFMNYLKSTFLITNILWKISGFQWLEEKNPQTFQILNALCL